MVLFSGSSFASFLSFENTNFNGLMAVSAQVGAMVKAEPSMHAGLKLTGKNFEQVVRVSYPREIGLSDVRNIALNGSLMKELSDWVADASFGKQGDEATSLTLTIGKMGIKFTHKFDCQEASSLTSWSINCSEISDESLGKQVIRNAKRSVSCAIDERLANTVCDFEMSGKADDIGLLMSSISGSEVAFILFIEDTSYLAHLNLMVAMRASTSAQARTEFLKSEYKVLITDLKSQSPNFERLPNEVLVASATQSEEAEGFFDESSSVRRQKVSSE